MQHKTASSTTETGPSLTEQGPDLFKQLVGRAGFHAHRCRPGYDGFTFAEVERSQHKNRNLS